MVLNMPDYAKIYPNVGKYDSRCSDVVNMAKYA